VEFDAGHEGFYGPPPTESEPLAWHPRRPPPAQCREAEPVRWALEAPHPGPQPQCCHVFAAADACGVRTREYLLSPHGGCASSGVRARLNRGLVIDCFAGGGGASTGIEQAIGRAVDVAINHSPAAVAMHKANHPTTKHWCQDIRTVTPRQVCGDSKVWIVWLSPDCFPAGTMVLTRTGYRPIEQIVVGDEVLTHAGRWRPVTRLWHSQKQLTEIRGHGHPGLVVSPGHPILTRQRDDRWNNAERRSERRLGPASWQPASVLGKGNYWATPTDFPASEAPPLPARAGRRATVGAELMWLAGRYIADGWTRLDDQHAELVLSCGKHKVDAMRDRLRALADRGAADGDDPIRWAERELRTTRQFTACHRPLVEWLREHFGHLAPFKRIPGWALGLPEDLRQALLDGYLSGDGHRSKPGAVRGNPLVSAETVSRALAFGLKALASSLGKTVNVYLRENNCNVIEGREVNARPIWKLTWRDGDDMGHKQTWREEGMEWAPIREQKTIDLASEPTDVYTLSVADDESYVAEGVVVKNCTHHSRAKGGKPRDQKIRSLARVAIDWANDVTPDVLFLENVIEFKQWGPLDAHGKPIKARAGEDFELFVRDLAAAGPGYDIEFRTLVAADYGTPTSRTRLFMVARRKGSAAIAWPDPTHGKGAASPWKTAAEIIDFSFPTRSIFGRKKPLRPATLRRIATGLRKYVLESQNPFIIPVTHQGDARTHGIDEPVRTVTGANRGELALVTPFIESQYTRSVGREVCNPLPTVSGHGHHSLVTPHVAPAEGHGDVASPFVVPVKSWGGGGNGPLPLDGPMRTVTASKRGEFALVEPQLSPADPPVVAAPYVMTNTTGHASRSVDAPVATITTGDHHYVVSPYLAGVSHGEFEERPGSRTTPLDEPVRTVTASNDHAVITPYLAMATHTTSGDRVASAEKPLNTITCAKGGEMMLVAPTLVSSGYGEREGQEPRTLDIESPLTTVVAGGQKHNLVAALLTTNFTGAVGRKMTDPAPTVTGRDHTSVTTAHLASSHLLKLYGTSHSADVRGPLPTVTGGGQHLAEVRALMELVADPGTLGPDSDCVTVRIGGLWYVIVDIHMRMLQPKELFGAQGFPPDYLIHFYYLHKGKRKRATKTDQIKLAGNSVCPQVAKRLVLANAFN